MEKEEVYPRACFLLFSFCRKIIDGKENDYNDLKKGGLRAALFLREKRGWKN